jgi:hypothetical protein
MSKKIENQNMNTENAIIIDKRDPGFWRDAWQQVRLVFALLGDREVPFYLKLLPFLTLFYVLWPLDLLPGLPFDDATALLVGAKVFIELAPPHVVIKHLNQIRAKDGYGPIEEVGGETAIGNDVIEGEVIKEKKG